MLEKLRMQSNFLSCGNVNVENAQKEYFIDFSHNWTFLTYQLSWNAHQ